MRIPAEAYAEVVEGKPGAKEVAGARWIRVCKVSDSRRIAREVAKSLGLRVAGTLAVIHEALRRKLIAAKSFEGIIAEMKENGFWISDEIAESFRKS